MNLLAMNSDARTMIFLVGVLYVLLVVASVLLLPRRAGAIIVIAMSIALVAGILLWRRGQRQTEETIQPSQSLTDR